MCIKTTKMPFKDTTLITKNLRLSGLVLFYVEIFQCG